MSILLNKKTRDEMEAALNAESHAFIFKGEDGAGKTYAARWFSSSKLGFGKLGRELDDYPYFLTISPEGGTIGISSIRRLHEFFLLKTIGTNKIKRVALIEDAHRLTLESQNALLKLLEEPPEDTLLVLTANEATKLKDTIYSRVQHIYVHPVSLPESIDYFSRDKKQSDIKKNFLMSGGNAGLLAALLKELDHPLKQAIHDAKSLLVKNSYQRLLEVDVLSKDKQQTALIIRAFKVISKSALIHARKSDNKSITKLLSMYKKSLIAEANLKHNPNHKLLLTELFLNL